MNPDPNHIENDELKLEMEQNLAGFSQDDMEALQSADPHEPRTDDKGRLEGVIIDIRGADVFVDVGGKSEGVLPLDEFDENEPPQPGQRLTFIMQGTDKDSGQIRLSLKAAKSEAALEELSVGDVIEARVTGVNLGGLELMTNQIRAFMPKSQVELERIDDFAPYIGQKLECQVTEVDRKGKTLVVSRRKLLEQDREEQRQQLKYALQEGDTRAGTVRRLTDFGAFVDLGGLDGLLHVSDMSYARVNHPKEVVKVGDQIQVKILKIDLVKDRISLGLKQLQQDPWGLVDANYREGTEVTGKVVKLMDFGAFVELEPGIEGLIPMSEMSWTQRIRHAKDVLSEGESVRVKLINVDAAKRKLTLSLKAMGEDPWTNVADTYKVDEVVKGSITRLADFGAFVQLQEGVEGLVHVSEMSDKHVRRPSEVVKEGDVVEVRVKGIDMEQRRISLSMRTAAPDAAPPPESAPDKPRKKKKKLKGGLDSGFFSG